MMRLLKRNVGGSEHQLDHGALSIDCRSCANGSDMKNPECVRCIVKGIISVGECSRIILHGNSDIEYYGDFVSMFIEMTEVGNSILNMAKKEDEKKCRLCKARPLSVSAAMWTSFPETDTDDIRRSIREQEPSGKNCEECLMHTYGSLEQIEFLLNEVSRNAAKCAFSLAGI